MTTDECLATSRWTWTDEARDAAQTALLSARWPDGDYVIRLTTDDYPASAVLAAVTPHVARQIAGLKRENDDYHDDLIRVMWERRAAEDEAAWLRAKLNELRGGE